MLILTLAALCCGGMVSCVNESGLTAEPDGGSKEKVALLFQISPIAVDPTSPTAAEQIKSLRIIVLNETGVECNRLITEGQDTPAATFKYDFRWWTDPGVKQLYVIANEESVSTLSYETDSEADPPVELPEEKPTSLTDLLEAYGPEGNNDVEELQALLNSAYFSPEYADDEDNIYLPYSVYYGDINAVEGTVVPMEVFLVPVATKFEFHFLNYREDPINVSDIQLSYANTANFLMGHVTGSDVSKTFDGTNYYWVDWLAKVSAESQANDNPFFGPNQDLNKLYGWISSYTLPADNQSLVRTFVSDTEGFDVPGLQIPEITDGEDEEEVEALPGTKSTRCFYVPESRNFTNPEKPGETMTAQQYYLSMVFKDRGNTSKKPPTFENVAISNLGALFRNTHVIVTVTFREGSVDVYAEIADWNKKYSYGWLVEGPAPNPNPLGKRKN